MIDVNCFTNASVVRIDTKRLEELVLKQKKDLNSLRGGVVVSSSEEELLVKACLKNFFFLVNPLNVKGFYKSNALIRSVVDNDKVFEIPLKPLLHSSFVYRAKMIKELRLFLEKCVKLNVRFVFTSRAENEFDLKTEREWIAILQGLGLTRQQTVFALNEESKRVLEELS